MMSISRGSVCVKKNIKHREYPWSIIGEYYIYKRNGEFRTRGYVNIINRYEILRQERRAG